MGCGKCGKYKKGGLCPFSLGLALGLTCALGMFIMSLYIMYYGVPPMMMVPIVAPFTWSVAGIYIAVALVKGFFFGFVLALIYDCIVCCFKRKPEHSCDCNCACCNSCCNSTTCSCNCGCCANPNKDTTKPVV